MHTFAGLQQEEYKQLIDATLEGKDVAMLDGSRIIVPPKRHRQNNEGAAQSTLWHRENVQNGSSTLFLARHEKHN